MSNRKTKLAFIGLGTMGQVAHLRNYVLHPDVEIVAAAEIRQELGRRVIRQYGIPKLYHDHYDLLAHEKEIDGIVAIQPFTIHGGLLPGLMERGVPILIEKPLARSTQAGEKILAVAQATGTPVYIAYHKRSDLAVMYARSTIRKWKESGVYGRMKYVRITMPPGPWPAPLTGFDTMIHSQEPYPDLVHDPMESGLDEPECKRLEAFVNYYIHQVNLMRHLMDEDYSVSYADPTGVVLGVNSNRRISGIIEMAPYSSSVDWQEQAFVAFERAWIRIDIPGPLVLDTAGQVAIYRDRQIGSEPELFSPSLASIPAMRQQARHFIEAIRGGRTPLCRPEEAMKDLRLARDYLEKQR